MKDAPNTKQADRDPTIDEINEFMKRATRSTSLPIPAGVIPLEGWRWILDGSWIILEPRAGKIAMRDMDYLDMFPETTDIEVVFRTTPSAGVYLRFRLRVSL